MNRLLLAAVLGAGAVAAPLAAKDSRLISRPYNADEVVRIDGRAGVQAGIAFADDELIENVAIGDSASWQVTPNKRATMLFLKPLATAARTNLTVVTDKRSYFFDLVASPKAQPLYVLRFTYPEEAGSQAAAAEEPSAAEPALGSAVAEPPIDPATLNFAWESKGKRQLLPARIYDDGASTYLSFAASRSIPAILVRDSKGAEGPVNFAVRDDVLVIEGVPRLLVLRSGRDMATLENRGEPRRPSAPPAADAIQGTAVATAITKAPPAAPAGTEY